MPKQSKLHSVVLYGSLVAFLVFVAVVLYVNREVLYTAHDRSEFIFGSPFFHAQLSKPFGLMVYAGAWLTQLFSRPAVGAVVLITLWVLIFWVGARAFRLAGSSQALMLLPVACLLTSVVDLGYWIYISPIRGYFFSQTLGYLCMLLLLWAARSTPCRWHLLWYVVAFCAYPVLGWFALLFILCLILSGKPSWRELIGLLLVISAAVLWRSMLYSHLKLDEVVLAGFPRFETPSDTCHHLATPLWLLAVISLLLPLLKGGSKYLSHWLVPVACLAVGCCFTWSLMFSDRNYTDEMRMVRLAADDNWQEVLSVFEANPHPTRTMIFLKNIALMNEGGLLDRSFKMGNNDVPLHNPDTLHVTLLDIASPLVYYHYGMLNEAVRLSYENGIQAGFSPFYLKVLARCARTTGDEPLLQRYTTLIRRLPFLSEWQALPPTKTINELRQSYPDELTGVENSDSYIVNSISLWYESSHKVTSEQALFYSMIRCDSRRFWPSLRNFIQLHMNEQFPLHAQEAYILFMDKAPEDKRMMLPVEQSVYDRYKRFWAAIEGLAKTGVSLEKAGEHLRPEFGDTYWWYNIFGRKIY